MLSFRRLLSILVVTILISAVLISYSINSSSIDIVSLTNDTYTDAEPLPSGIKASQPYRFVLFGTDSDVVDGTVKDNAVKETIVKVLTDSKADFSVAQSMAQLSVTGDIAVFCKPNVSSYADLREVEKFLREGGRAIFAAGLSETHSDSYLYSVLGIIEKNLPMESRSFNVSPDFFPFSDESVVCPDYNASAFLKIVDDATVYLSDAQKGFPIVYTKKHELGSLAVINSTLLEYPNNGGLFTATAGALLGDFVYPVLGSSSIFLDNFPISTNVNDAESMRLYGRSTEAFIVDRVWPVFQGVAVRNNLRYTSGVMTAGTGLKKFAPINTNLFYTIGKSAMQFGGEVAFTGSFSEDGELIFNDEFTAKFAEIFENYNVNAFALQDGYPTKEQLQGVLEHYPSVSILRGYGGSGDNGQQGYYGFGDESCYSLPLYSRGMDYETANEWRIMMSVAEKGLLSHLFDINTVMGLASGSSGWEENNKQLELYESQVFKPLSWLQSRTLSGQIPLIDAYRNTRYGWTVSGNQLELGGEQLYSGQTFLLRTDKKIAASSGCSYRKVNNKYYLITVQSPKSTLTFE